MRRALYRASKVPLAEQDNRHDDHRLLRSLPFPRIGVGMSGLNACLRWEPCGGMCVDTRRPTKKWKMPLNEHDQTSRYISEHMNSGSMLADLPGSMMRCGIEPAPNLRLPLSLRPSRKRELRMLIPNRWSYQLGCSVRLLNRPD